MLFLYPALPCRAFACRRYAADYFPAQDVRPVRRTPQRATRFYFPGFLATLTIEGRSRRSLYL